MKSHVLIAALGGLAVFGTVLGLAGAASAQSEYQAARSVFDRETVSVPVAYGDLDLSTRDGAATMLQRMHHAAMNACGASDFSVKDYRWSVSRSACVHRSLDEAVASLNAPRVNELYGAGPNAWGA